MLTFIDTLQTQQKNHCYISMF